VGTLRAESQGEFGVVVAIETGQRVIVSEPVGIRAHLVHGGYVLGLRDWAGIAFGGEYRRVRAAI